MATGIKDKIAIIGMGCTKFGERWDAGAEELMVEAFEESLCVGCGRCGETCLAGINVPEVIASVRGEGG